MIHETYVEIIRQRYGQLRSESYEMQGYYDGILLAPNQYKTEASMLRYVQEHPSATLQEVFFYFNKITPDGLAPGDVGNDL